MSIFIIKRREFLGGLALAVFSSPFLSVLASAKQEQAVTIKWYVPNEQSVDIQESLEFKGQAIPDKSTQEDDRSPALIYILVGAVALGTLAETLLKVYKDWKYGGIIVSKDKKGKLLIKSEPILDRGTIIVDQGKEPKIIFKEKDEPKYKELMDALSALEKK
jgi:hypothetical protein